MSAYGSVCWGPTKWPSLKLPSSILQPSSKILDFCPFQLLFHLSLQNTRRGELAILLLTFISELLGKKTEIDFDHRMKGPRKKSESIWHLLFPLCVTHVRKILTCLHDFLIFFFLNVGPCHLLHEKRDNVATLVAGVWPWVVRPVKIK